MIKKPRHMKYKIYIDRNDSMIDDIDDIINNNTDEEKNNDNNIQDEENESEYESEDKKNLIDEREQDEKTKEQEENNFNEIPIEKNKEITEEPEEQDINQLKETDENDFDSMVAVNLKGTFLVIRAVLPFMMDQESGHIINIISSAGKKGFPNCAAYCASKFGATGLTEVLRHEVRQYNIHVTAIYPGAVDTTIWDNIDGNWDRKQMIKPESVARSVLHVCQNSGSAMIEEIFLMPEKGDL